MTTLKRFLEKLDNERDVYIGSKSAFIFMDKPHTFLENVDKYNKECLERFASTVTKSEATLANLKANKPKKGATQRREVWQNGCKVVKILTYEELLQEWELKVYRMTQNLKNSKAQLKNFISLEEREISQAYKSIDGNAIIVLVPGNECGRFWLKSEWERYKNGDKVIVIGDDEEEEDEEE